MKTLMILSNKKNANLEFIQVINESEKLAYAKKYRKSKSIDPYFFDVPEDERAALALGLYQAKEELIQPN